MVGDRFFVFGGADLTRTAEIVPPGQIEVLDFSSKVEVIESGTVVSGPTWSLEPTAGESPSLDAGLAAHAVGGKGHVVLISNKSAGIFNSPSVLDTASMPLQWSSLKIDWHGDWTMIPGCRQAH